MRTIRIRIFDRTRGRDPPGFGARLLRFCWTVSRKVKGRRSRPFSEQRAGTWGFRNLTRLSKGRTRKSKVCRRFPHFVCSGLEKRGRDGAFMQALRSMREFEAPCCLAPDGFSDLA